MNIPESLFLSESSLGIVTDLYQLTMAAGYFDNKIRDIATFELSVRQLPENRSYLVVAGIEQSLHYLAQMKFSDDTIKFLKDLPIFSHVSRNFFEYLKNFKFGGDIYTMPEGTIAFAEEPIMRITAPIIEAQIIETYLLSTINFQTLIATKASRIVHAARGRDVIDFGTRRAHGPQAGILAARACFIGGCKGTSNIFAAYKLGIPAMGTIAHSWVMAFENERNAFHKFYKTFPDNTNLLIDTYDTLTGAKHAATIGRKLIGVRIDSGDLVKLSKRVRKILDNKGLRHVKIIASGDLNEERIDYLLRNDASVDSFGVGTEMVTSKDAPALGGVYKLVELEHNNKSIPKMKFSKDKITYPGKKQVYRSFDKDGNFTADVIGLEDENNKGAPLLIQAIKKGKLYYKLPSIHEIQENAINNLSRLPEPFKRLKKAKTYPVTKSNKLESKMNKIKTALTKTNIT
ncbi:MAG: nicotinate phosphoribosyltransferase [Planctomycetes bacterium RIFCSPHIGHO2_12_39_6]|nr:MAG: nicotinate phosphoribosyltransferase [Planctomycetes bacterium RIFCSPHIGHO2_12_39_6]